MRPESTHRLLLVACTLVTAIGLAACGADDGNSDQPMGPQDGTTTFEEEWPTDLAAVMTQVYLDPEGDQVQMPVEQAGPPYDQIMVFPAIDVTAISMGVEGDFLYMRIDFAGTIPTAAVYVPAEGQIEEQWARNQGTNVSVNADGDIQTGGGGEGVNGVDIFFAVGFDYGNFTNVYANYGFPSGDLHQNTGQSIGELGDGGQGSDFVVVRYHIAEFTEFFPPGATVEIGSWSEAESFNRDGSLKYHHFAFDRVIEDETFEIPAVSAP